MTREYREWLRREIDAARRARLRREARLEGEDVASRRRAYLASYYQANRERIRIRDRRKKAA